MAKNNTKQLLINYVDAASNLADSVKRNIVKNGLIDDKTVVALNEFTIAANLIKDLTYALDKGSRKH